MPYLSAQILGGDDVHQALVALIRESTSQAVEDTFSRLRAEVELQFETHGRAFGQIWQNRTKDRPWPLLEHTGRLRNSLTDRNHPEHIEQILAGPGSTLVGIFGTGVPYASPLHFGTTHMPARPLLTEAMLR